MPEARPTNGKAAPGAFMDAQGKPTKDPDLGYYGRTERAQLDEAYQAATEKQPDAVADVQPQAEKAPPAAEVIDVAEKATREANPSAETAQPPASVTVPSSEADCVVCGGDLYRCFPLKCPLKSASRERFH